ncbi:MAG: DCC1-like thiol-disulfide oxidoreductase family protein [Elusimicrobiota bacterium]|nr:MAG: DCC1-like thiol-disulfide oxidoreductase family protein [Elusimicrobiota bacterium]
MQMSNGWTYRQYLAFRAALGAYVAIHFAALLPWAAELFAAGGVVPAAASPLLGVFPNILALNDGPAAAAALTALGAVCGVAIAFGAADRVAAVAAWYVWACLFGRNPLISNPSLPYVGWLLLAHAAISPSGVEDSDARRAWRVPEPVYRAAWVVLAVGYTYSGLCKLGSPSWFDGGALRAVLENPLARPWVPVEWLPWIPAAVLKAATWGALALEIGFVGLACSRSLRPWAWAAMTAMHVALLATLDFADLTWGMLLIHAFTFDPAWLKGRGEGEDVVFYDGQCGLCQTWIQLLLEEDRRAASFRFAPLGGRTYHELLDPGTRASLPDSIVVRAADGRVLVKSAAIGHLLGRLGGLWLVAQAGLSLVPAGLADRGYDLVAKVRRVAPVGIKVCRRMPARYRARLLG